MRSNIGIIEINIEDVKLSIYLEEISEKTIIVKTKKNKRYCILLYLKLSLLKTIIRAENNTIAGINNGLILLLNASSIKSLY